MLQRATPQPKGARHGRCEALDAGEAALVIVGRSQLEETLDRELRRANKRIEKQLDTDAKAFEKELDQASTAS